MESFSPDWLALREPADHAARAAELAAEVAVRLQRKGRAQAIDLAAGTGSNVRYLLPRLPHITQWTLVDHDEALLEVARASLGPLAAAHHIVLETRVLGLADIDALPLGGCALVTASALLDLVSGDWLRGLARRCREVGADVLCTLNYDGRIAFDPHDPGDERIRTLVNLHQQTDKGFGPALGPAASLVAEDAFGGWEIAVAASDWRLSPEDRELQHQLVEGWAGAARELVPEDASHIDDWRARRLGHIDAGRSRMRVGHRDLAAWDESIGGRMEPSP